MRRLNSIEMKVIYERPSWGCNIYFGTNSSLEVEIISFMVAKEYNML